MSLEEKLLETQVQEVKALGGGRWRWTRHQSTKQTDIEFAMNQVDLDFGVVFFTHLMYAVHRDVFWTRYFYFWFVNAELKGILAERYYF